ncbi:hypothetical protein PDIG_44950 [Penicillium digitatum PHI26]|uniref:Uncharacterized protein n=2 Tax=Penicillium digitatum TaxID=36651 RepID=K9FV31_PEND2|nr:hypothetical protein PDIP_16930 [Penicillium digitatum Pd1]EKV12367.1 hypothetical protein PDIG_44950 [Penicillium digitatum PHI26]EKV20397.1 hypothetical protein PDIP_16930 [Penicillium digitatum Pd1]
MDALGGTVDANLAATDFSSADTIFEDDDLYHWTCWWKSCNHGRQTNLWGLG